MKAINVIFDENGHDVIILLITFFYLHIICYNDVIIES